MKQLYNITNKQGASLATIKAKDVKNAIRQARKLFTGKVKAIELGMVQQ